MVMPVPGEPARAPGLQRDARRQRIRAQRLVEHDAPVAPGDTPPYGQVHAFAGQRAVERQVTPGTERDGKTRVAGQFDRCGLPVEPSAGWLVGVEPIAARHRQRSEQDRVGGQETLQRHPQPCLGGKRGKFAIGREHVLVERVEGNFRRLCAPKHRAAQHHARQYGRRPMAVTEYSHARVDGFHLHWATSRLARSGGKLSAPGATTPGREPVRSRHLLEFRITAPLLQVKQPS
jgi:hypothetical protein